MKKNQLI